MVFAGLPSSTQKAYIDAQGPWTQLEGTLGEMSNHVRHMKGKC